MADNERVRDGAVEFEVVDGLAHIRLNRPEVRNALDYRTAAELYEAARRCAETEGLRAVLLTGAGPVFTVGGDIDSFGDAGETARPDLLRGSASQFHEVLRRLLSLDAPIVCAVQGAAAGGGLGLLYCADVVLAGESARFALGYGAIGLSSDGGNSWFLPRLVGLRRAAELYFEGRVLTAAEAADWGLITRVVPDEALQEEALSVARKLAAGPTRAYAEMRQLMRDSWDRDASGQFDAEEQALARTAATADAAEGMSAFLDKRPTKFQGR